MRVAICVLLTVHEGQLQTALVALRILLPGVMYVQDFDGAMVLALLISIWALLLAGYGMVPPYGYGVAPYAAFPGVVMGGYGYGYPPGYAAPGFSPTAAVPAYGVQPQQPQQPQTMQPLQQPQQQQRLMPAGRGTPGAYRSQTQQLMGQQQQQQQPLLQQGATER